MIGGPGQALAQTAPGAADDGSALEVVIVTAEKRKANLQDVPVAVQAISANDLTSKGLTGTEQLTAAVPGLVMATPANVGNPYLRGIGSNLFDPSAEQSVAMYVDGVYIAAPQSNIFNFNNVNDIEVLKGPQGTLFGRNAVAGVIQITTKDPSFTPKGEASVGYGNYDDLTASGYLTGGLGEKVAVDFAALYENQGDGYGHDLTLNVKDFREAIGNYSLRSKLLLQPADATKVVLSADYSHSVSTNAYQKPQGVFSPLDGSTYPGRFNSLGDVNPRNLVNTGGVSLRFDQDIGNYHILDIAAYRRSDITYDLDDDITKVKAADIRLQPRAHNYSEELQISSPADGWLKWIAGAYYYNAYAGYEPVYIDGGEQVADSQKSVSYAGFGQLTASVYKDTELTLGTRYTTEKQDYALTFPLALQASQRFSKMTYRAALNYHFTPDYMGYVSYSTGFKSGGYNLLDPGNAFKPESLDAYEVGLKSEMLDRTLRLNADAFYYKDHEVQVLTAVLGGTITSNAAAAEIKGFEADFEYIPVSRLKISGGISLQRGHYTTFPSSVATTPNGVVSTIDAAGNQTIITPHSTGNLSVDYTIQTSFGDIDPNATFIYNSGYFWQADNRLVQPSYHLINASVLWSAPGERFSVRLWGKNLTDSTYYIARLAVASIGDVQEQAPPRTYGVTFNAKF